MQKILLVLPIVLCACATGTKEVNKKYWAYTHQVMSQSKTEIVALANVGEYVNEQYNNPIYSVKLVLKNCNYKSDWIDDSFYSWSGSLINTNKSYSYTTVMGATKTVPSYLGDCSVQDVRKVSCYLWQDKECLADQEKAEDKK